MRTRAEPPEASRQWPGRERPARESHPHKKPLVRAPTDRGDPPAQCAIRTRARRVMPPHTEPSAREAGGAASHGSRGERLAREAPARGASRIKEPRAPIHPTRNHSHRKPRAPPSAQGATGAGAPRTGSRGPRPPPHVPHDARTRRPPRRADDGRAGSDSRVEPQAGSHSHGSHRRAGADGEPQARGRVSMGGRLRNGGGSGGNPVTVGVNAALGRRPIR